MFELNENKGVINPILENRPQIAELKNRNLSNNEIEYIEDLKQKILHKKKSKQLFGNITIGEFINNTINFLTNFMEEYSLKYLLITNQYKFKKENKGMINNIRIIIVSFINYLNDNDNIMYFGVVLIIISFLLYFLNITSN
jgi:hypothetical protein